MSTWEIQCSSRRAAERRSTRFLFLRGGDDDARIPVGKVVAADLDSRRKSVQLLSVWTARSSNELYTYIYMTVPTTTFGYRSLIPRTETDNLDGGLCKANMLSTIQQCAPRRGKTIFTPEFRWNFQRGCFLATGGKSAWGETEAIYIVRQM